jgi:pyruvate formate lyase activating enzyme
VTWVGLDVKGALAGYPALTGGGEASARRIRESLSLVLASGVDHEVRTTVHPDLLDREAILALARELVAMGVRRYALQRCASARCLSPRLRTPAHASPLDAELARRIGQIVPEFLGIRA